MASAPPFFDRRMRTKKLRPAKSTGLATSVPVYCAVAPSSTASSGPVSSRCMSGMTTGASTTVVETAAVSNTYGVVLPASAAWITSATAV